MHIIASKIRENELSYLKIQLRNVRLGNNYSIWKRVYYIFKWNLKLVISWYSINTRNQTEKYFYYDVDIEKSNALDWLSKGWWKRIFDRTMKTMRESIYANEWLMCFFMTWSSWTIFNLKYPNDQERDARHVRDQNDDGKNEDNEI